MTIASSFLGLQGYEWWIVLVGGLAGMGAGVIGCFLILRRMALMGDAISHAVLPGIVVGAWIAGSVASWWVMVGALCLGVLTPLLIDVLQASGRIHEDASLGIVFTVLFSLGVIMVSRMQNVHLDVDCVLFGEIATTHLDQWVWGGMRLGPRAAWVLGGVLLLNVAFVVAFYKELKLTTFDEGLARAMGLHPRLLHYGLLGLVALTTIAAFESVGAIIVVAMLIVPGATAYLLTDRLSVMLVLAGVVGFLCSVLGYGMSVGLGGKVSIAGCMAAAAGALFAVVFLFSWRDGVLVRMWRRARLSRRLSREHLLMVLYRADEAGRPWMSEGEAFGGEFGHGRVVRATARQLMVDGMVLWEEGRLRLTPSGLKQAERLVRAHRLWEAYLESRLGLPPDHLHRAADDVEHFLDPELQELLSHVLEHPTQDPHGKPIPGKFGQK